MGEADNVSNPELRRLAEAARAANRKAYGKDQWYGDDYVDISASFEEAECAFISALSPGVVLGLLDRIAALEAVAEAAQTTCVGLDDIEMHGRDALPRLLNALLYQRDALARLEEIRR